MKLVWYILILYQNMCEQVDIDRIGYDIELMTFREKVCVRVLLKDVTHNCRERCHYKYIALT